MPFDHLQKKILSIIETNYESIDQKLTHVCILLQSSIDYYDWVGYYFANEKKRTLHLKAYAGAPTDHTVIPFGKGICGQVALSNDNFIVPDVKAQSNYLACNIQVKSEIVIPLFKNKKNIGQIDIDSHTKDPFSKEDEDFLVWVNEQVAEVL